MFLEKEVLPVAVIFGLSTAAISRASSGATFEGADNEMNYDEPLDWGR